MFIVQSEYDGNIFVANNAISPLEAVEQGREQGVLGTLNAVQVQDQNDALIRIRAEIRRIYEECDEHNEVLLARDLWGSLRNPRQETKQWLEHFPNSRRFVGNEFNGFTVVDFHVGPWTFTYYPYTGAGGGGPWRVCNT